MGFIYLPARIKDLEAKATKSNNVPDPSVGIGSAVYDSMNQTREGLLAGANELTDQLFKVINQVSQPTKTIPQKGVTVGSLGISDFNFRVDDFNLLNASPTALNISGGGISGNTGAQQVRNWKPWVDLGLVIVGALSIGIFIYKRLN